MATTKLVLGALAGIMVAFAAGWLLGSSGRGETVRVAAAAELRSDFLQARGAALAARVDLYNVNFGDASRHLEEAKAPLRHAEGQLKTEGRTEDVTRVEAVLAQLNEAQQMAGRLDQGANARTAAAIKTLEELVAPGATP